MFEIITNFIAEHQLLPDQGRVIVAVSGGADSLCLLHLLHRLCGSGKRYPDVQLHVAHLNHCLRGEASVQDAAAVTHLAQDWKLPVTSGTVDVPALARREHRSLEEAARVARYRFLREIAQGQPIAIAHHCDDQVETLLLHWLRGGGIASMVGLQPRQHDLIRPLLAVTHADTLAYCQRHQLTPLEDASNFDLHFLRNRLRHELVPLLEALNPGIQETLLRNAEIMHTDYQWIEAQVAASWSTVVAEEHDERIQLRISALRTLPLSLQRHLLRRVTAQLNAGQSPLELRHHHLIEQLLQRENNEEMQEQRETTRAITLHFPHQLRVTRQADTLLCERVPHDEKPVLSTLENTEAILSIPGSIAVPGTPWTARAEWVSEETLRQVKNALQRSAWPEVWRTLPATRYAVYIDAESLYDNEATRQHTPCLRVRTRRAGDRMRPLGMLHEKKLQDMLIDKHIPRAERDQFPLFFSASHCVWLGGIQLDDRVRLTENTQHIIRLSIEKTAEYSSHHRNDK